jgi:S1-C subfamily serine protease
MKLLKIAAFTVTLAGVVGLALGLAPSVYGQSRGRELTILGGRGGELGVSIVDGQSGVEIEEVHADSAADKAGLKRGDVMLEFDGERVRSTRQLPRLIQETPSGRNVTATISRDGKRQDVQLTLSEGRDARVILGDSGRFFQGFTDRLPDMEREFRDLQKNRDIPGFAYKFFGPDAGFSGGRLGVTVDELTGQLATYFGAKEGVLVTSVSEGSSAETAGIKAGDVITSIDGEPVHSSADLIQSLRRTQTEDVSIGIIRDKKAQTLKAKVEAPRRTPRGARPA